MAVLFGNANGFVDRTDRKKRKISYPKPGTTSAMEVLSVRVPIRQTAFLSSRFPAGSIRKKPLCDHYNSAFSQKSRHPSRRRKPGILTCSKHSPFADQAPSSEETLFDNPYRFLPLSTRHTGRFPKPQTVPSFLNDEKTCAMK